MTIRAVYERRKEDFLNTQSKTEEDENKGKTSADKFKDICELAAQTRDSQKGADGKYDTSTIMLSLNVNRSTAQLVRKHLKNTEKAS